MVKYGIDRIRSYAYLSCGERDRLYPMSVELADYLKALGIRHRFDHRPGTHRREFWEQSRKDSFAYLFV